jgi:hypothetical protein
LPANVRKSAIVPVLGEAYHLACETVKTSPSIPFLVYPGVYKR